ncbi:MAG: DUF4091 domain-containing protein [Lachnospiraceae bacterium]|nr:DUF4091 domain-containing protein [Lachnospiraceae bacterium]
MICKVFSANEWLYPDTAIELGKSNIKLVAARQSFACAQVLISNPDEIIKISWDLGSCFGDINPEIFVLHQVCADMNTGVESFTMPIGATADHYTRQAPFWVYDAMEPIESSAITSDKEVMALYFRWSTENILPGEYNGTISINNNKIEVSIRVYDVEIPKKETLRITNWFSLADMATYHNTEEMSDKHWELMKEYALLMRHARQTDFTLTSYIVDITKNSDDKYIFDFSRAEKYIKLFLSLGFSYIESMLPIHRNLWEDNNFVIYLEKQSIPAISAKAYEYIQGYCEGLYNMLKRNGWLDITVQHVADEPHDNCVNEYRILSDMVRKFMPGIKIIEAVETSNLDGAVDIWVPKNNQIASEWETFNKKRTNGDELWFYTCCVPGGKYLNRFLDGELLRVRYLHWANKLYDLTGYLHWGLNCYNCATHPFNASSGKVGYLEDKALPCGDTHIVYPGRDKPWGSVRLEMMRAGCEDYELLKMLDNKKSKPIISKCVRSFVDYSVQIETFESTYEELLIALS